MNISEVESTFFFFSNWRMFIHDWTKYSVKDSDKSFGLCFVKGNIDTRVKYNRLLRCWKWASVLLPLTNSQSQKLFGNGTQEAGRTWKMNKLNFSSLLISGAACFSTICFSMTLSLLAHFKLSLLTSCHFLTGIRPTADGHPVAIGPAPLPHHADRLIVSDLANKLSFIQGFP